MTSAACATSAIQVDLMGPRVNALPRRVEISMIDTKTIQHIAQLSRLRLNTEKSEELAQQLAKILEHFQKISNLPTDGVEPLVTPTEIENFWRDDQAEKNYTTEEMTQNAPSRQGSLFKVPPVV